MGERSGRRARARAAGDAAPVRITTAAPSPGTDIAARQRRYIVSMAIRTVCVVGAVAVGPGPLRWLLVAGAVLLPYVAVVFANATDHRSPDTALPTGTGHLRELDGPRE